MRRRSFLLGVAGAVLLPRPSTAQDFTPPTEGQGPPEGQVGIRCDDVRGKGAHVEFVTAGSTGQRAGILIDDTITHVLGTPLAGKNRWAAQGILHQAAGASGQVQWLRANVPMSATLTWEPIPEAELEAAWRSAQDVRRAGGHIEQVDDFATTFVGLLELPVGQKLPLGAQVLLAGQAHGNQGVSQGRLTAIRSHYRVEIRVAITAAGTGMPKQWDAFEVMLS